MTKPEFNAGDRVSWKYGAGKGSGHIIEKLTKATKLYGKNFKATAEEPKYKIKSDKGKSSQPTTFGDPILFLRVLHVFIFFTYLNVRTIPWPWVIFANVFLFSGFRDNALAHFLMLIPAPLYPRSGYGGWVNTNFLTYEIALFICWLL